MNKSILIFAIYFVSISSCQKIGWFPDDELTLIRSEYSDTSIRIDGYYFRIIEETTYNEPYGQSYFFYSNGVLLEAGGFPLSEQQEFDNEILDRKYEDNYHNSKYNWGIFVVFNDTIKFEKWYPSSGGGLPVYIREGIILNDTSFHIIRSYRNTKDGIEEEREKDEMYYFHKLDYKPDSTNTFIE